MSNVKISALPTGTIAGTDTVPVVKAGVTTAVPFAHTHPESDVTSLVTDLAGKAAASHTHAESDVTNLTTDLASLQSQINGTVVGPAAGTGFATAGSNVYGPLYKLGRPDLISWTWQNQGTSTVVDANGVSFLTIPTSATSIRQRLIAAPARPYTITALLRNNGIGTNNNYCGLAFRESGTSKVYIFYILVDQVLQAVKFSNDTTFSAVGAVNTAIALTPNQWHWLQVTDNNTNLIFSYSSDGVNFIQAGSESRTAFFTAGPDQVGFFADTDGASGFSMTLASWVQT
jgi:hypothetical protein